MGATVTLDDNDSGYAYTANTDASGNNRGLIYMTMMVQRLVTTVLVLQPMVGVTKSWLLSITADESALTGEDATLRQAAIMTERFMRPMELQS